MTIKKCPKCGREPKYEIVFILTRLLTVPTFPDGYTPNVQAVPSILALTRPANGMAKWNELTEMKDGNK